jgi:hypothetical protein
MRREPTWRERLRAAVEAPHVDVAAVARAFGCSERTVRRELRDAYDRRIRALYRCAPAA